MATAVHAPHEHHGFDPALVPSRARIGVLLLILADVAFVAALYVSDAYLRILNIGGQFHPAREATPSAGAGLLLTIMMVVSAACYYFGDRRLQAGNVNQFRTALIVAWVLTLIAFVAQVVALFSLRYPTPIYAYGSVTLLMTAYHGVHLFITALIGFLLLGRVTRGRIVGHEYIGEVTGFWWYYVALTAVTSWAMMAFVK